MECGNGKHGPLTVFEMCTGAGLQVKRPVGDTKVEGTRRKKSDRKVWEGGGVSDFSLKLLSHLSSKISLPPPAS